MKRSTVIALFLALNFSFIVLHLHKQSSLIKLSYTKQKTELVKANLVKTKQELTHQLYALQEPTTIKQFAVEHGMKPLSITQVKRLSV